MAQTPFGAWLQARLDERGWRASDITRASTTSQKRGLDSGLISRWLAPNHGAVPTHVQSLQRLAAALNVSEREVYQAAGLIPADVPSSTVQTELETRLSRLGATLSQYPRAVWLSIIEANERMVDAWTHSAVPPVSAPRSGGVSASKTAQTTSNPRRKGQLPGSQHPLESLAVYA